MHWGRILVVAQDEDLRRSLTFALAAYGHAVTPRADLPQGEEASAFDCIVLDEHALPKSVTPARLFPTCPVLLLAYSQEGLANASVTGVIAMPLKGEAVPQAVAAALSGVRQNAK